MGRYYGGYYVPEPGETGTPLSQNPNQGTHTTWGGGSPGRNTTPSYNGAGTLNPQLTGGYGNNTSTGAPRSWTSDGGLGQAPPASPQAPPSSSSGGGGGSLPFVPYSPPGYGEDFYTKNKGFWETPGAAANYWNGVQGFFTHPQQGETDLNNYSKQLGGTPGFAESRYADNARSGLYDQPGAAEQFWSNFGSQFGTPGRGENAIGGVLDQLKAPGAAEEYYGRHATDFDSPGALEQLFPQLRDTLSRTGQTEILAQGYHPQNSYAEDFLLGGGAGGGLDAMYDRLYQLGSKRIGDEAAARGGYNSGASLRATQELNADLTGRHVQDLQAAVAAADAAKNQRLNYGLNLMKGADESTLGRMQGLASAGQATESAMANRLLAGGTLANNAQSGFLKRMEDTTSAGTAMGNLARERLEAGSAASGRAQEAATNRGRAGMDASKAAQDALMDRLTKAGGLSRDAENLALTRGNIGGGLAAAAGSEDNTRMAGGSSASHLAQQDKEERERGVLDNLMKVASAQASTYANMTSQQRQEELQLKMTEIQGLVNRGQISAAAGQQLTNLYMQLLGMPLSVAGIGGPPTPTVSPRVVSDNSAQDDFIKNHQFD